MAGGKGDPPSPGYGGQVAPRPYDPDCEAEAIFLLTNVGKSVYVVFKFQECREQIWRDLPGNNLNDERRDPRMKKLILAVATSLTIVNGYGQGVIGFQNGVGSEFYFNGISQANRVTSAPFNQQPASGTTSLGVLDVGLFWSTTPFSDLSSGTLAGIENIGSTPGQLAGNGSFAILGANPGEQVYVQVYAWDSVYGNSQAGMEACYAAGDIFMACSAGQANTVYGAIGTPLAIVLNTSPAPGNPLFGTAGNVFGRTVYSTPEPGTMVLGGLGAVALWRLRRRK
jgi:MYXO-CTERM domain-containing protein